MNPDRPLQPGDLVVIVEAHCDRVRELNLGAFCTVKTAPEPEVCRCHLCVGLWDDVCVELSDGEIRGAYPARWLRRIRPLDELEKIETREVIHA